MVQPSGLTTVSATLKGEQVKALFQTSTVPSSKKLPQQNLAQCTQSRIPCSLTASIKLFINNIPIFIPRSAYADLGDISTATLSVHNELTVLTIRGGDASEAYVVVLEFDGKHLRKRLVYSAENADHPLEVTQYYVVSTAD